MAKDVVMPALGMAQETGILLEWLKAEGDEVKKGEPLMLVETDKASVEIEAQVDGILTNVEIGPGDEVPVGTRIAILLGEGESLPVEAKQDKKPDNKVVSPQPDKQEASGSAPEAKSTPLAAAIAEKEQVDLAAVSSADGQKIRKADVLATLGQHEEKTGSSAGKVLASPKARRLAKEQGIDLSTLSGSGPDGAVLAEDINNAQTVNEKSEPASDKTLGTSRVWQVMAKRLTESWQNIPHFYLTAEVNVEAMEAWRQRLLDRSEIKITVTDLLVKVVASALQHHPTVNGQWADNEIHLNEQVNIGLAVAAEEGLQVPVIQNANSIGIEGIAQARTDLVAKAKENKLSMNDVSGGTFTISNLGMLGIDSFCAIVNPPQAAILAVGRATEKVVAVEGQMVIQKRMSLTLSCDHRVVDGAAGARFLQTLVGYIEDPMRILD